MMHRSGNGTDRSHSRRNRWVARIAICACLFQTGCVERRLTIRTNPPGARVFVDDYEIGTSPVSTRFVYYGTRKIRMMRDGFETLTVMHSVNAPWYELTPLDFISENLVPVEIRDERTAEFTLQPQMVIPTEDLLKRGEGLRGQTRSPGAVTVLPSAQQPGALPPSGLPPGAIPPGSPPPPFVPPPGSGPGCLPPNSQPNAMPPTSTLPSPLPPPGSTVPYPAANTVPPPQGANATPYPQPSPLRPLPTDSSTAR